MKTLASLSFCHDPLWLAALVNFSFLVVDPFLEELTYRSIPHKLIAVICHCPLQAW